MGGWQGGWQGEWVQGVRGVGDISSTLHILYYHMVLRPKGTSHNYPVFLGRVTLWSHLGYPFHRFVRLVQVDPEDPRDQAARWIQSDPIDLELQWLPSSR